MSKIILGIVADDFSGASDAASFLVKQGIKTFLFNGVPSTDLANDQADIAVVIALKTRTQETTAAVHESMRAFKWLKKNGATQFYSKYCSTFDSTKVGNIGPIIDAYLEENQIKYTVIAPALPVNGRIVQDGNLIVDGVPLHETHMKHHPLTPMWDSDLAELIGAQGKFESIKINADQLELTTEEIYKLIEDFGQDKDHFYIIPDYTNEIHATKIIELFGDLPFLTGGSGLMTALGKKYREQISSLETVESGTSGKAIVLAGSCSKATLAQIDSFKASGGKSIKLDPFKLSEGTQTKEAVWEEIRTMDDAAVLVYSSDKPENVKRAQASGIEAVSSLLEESTAYIAKQAEQHGFNRIVVAGGETSGAVTQTLGYNDYLVGESIAPGVPIMIPLENQDVRLVLKSGNFGQEDFFLRAIDLTRGGNNE